MRGVSKQIHYSDYRESPARATKALSLYIRVYMQCAESRAIVIPWCVGLISISMNSSIDCAPRDYIYTITCITEIAFDARTGQFRNPLCVCVCVFCSTLSSDLCETRLDFESSTTSHHTHTRLYSGGEQEVCRSRPH